ncbi:MAG: hypothetical protein A3F82_06370 [Deltaproteobacteria bacterium RIFCSPLOWO2_12_FULL_44_12]|nr:MAG: hypothetical protein A2712_00935 [Deltaproteobacteria bacterium RIFCSPHIGHO2_01_FULL_43_49]OGQ15297.1 MAG: hypothetical protein A3D22_04540 [Deltaproteobacteria bacterium RIFCSPHIGHO2_02_FULL_44_53]OGQ27079.1 MAG: hypothetical protein A3D98_01525 [Deltaproteobacteria bacterium RIFCSPHIGHO2_12_FULL_44_21]OGQ31813.1 MAG: hypothetical protein A2979_05700 [Deltaproteobacteria bacterium RIFCSPLOWO2_01_FULL_45_74]OGQ43015.1 MAG: hypothetical protein A3I70_08005 [Deltaproteobacteria bacterium 
MNPYLSLRLFYLFYFAIIGVLTPYFPVFLKEQGLRASQIGLVMAAWPVAKLVGPIFMSNLADRLNKRLFFIQMGALFCAITYLGFFKASGVWSFLLVMFIFSFFRMNILPLGEAIAMEYCEHHQKEYGKIRYWGSVGFIAASFLFGWLIDYFSIHIVLWGMLVIAILQWTSTFSLPPTHNPAQKKEYSLKPFWNKAIIGFLINSVFRVVSFGIYYTFFSIWMHSRGYSSSVIGFCWAIAVLSEVFVMIWFTQLTKRFSLKEIMGWSLVLTVLRWLILGSTAWLPAILFSQLLHAFTFGAYHLAAISYMYQHTPSHLRSTGQAIYTSVSFGLGSAIGFWGLSYLKEYFSFETMFLICAGIAALGLPFTKWFKEQKGMPSPIVGMAADQT